MFTHLKLINFAAFASLDWPDQRARKTKEEKTSLVNLKRSKSAVNMCGSNLNSIHLNNGF